MYLLNEQIEVTNLNELGNHSEPSFGVSSLFPSRCPKLWGKGNGLARFLHLGNEIEIY